MPLVLQQSSSAGSLMLPSTSSAGFGDLRLGAKLGLLRQRSFGVDGAATISVGFPSAKDASYIGEAGPVAEPGVVVSRRFTDAWRATATLGYRVRERTASLALVVDDELVAQLGVGFKLAALSGPAVELDASLSVATAAGDALGSFDRNYAELKLGGGFSPMPSIAVILGGGVGMSEGFGTPDWRAFAGARFRFSVGDALSGGGGGDEVDVPKLDIKEAGTISRDDVPPPKPTDDDGDGFMSDVDACPSQAETVNGYLDTTAAPTLPTATRTVGSTATTSAPTSPRTSTATPTRTAAPTPTTTPTAWPTARTSARGCRAWSRPAAAPTRIATATPSSTASTTAPTSPAAGQRRVQGQELVRLTGDKIEILDAVYFRTDKADIRSKSFKLLDNIVKVLATHPAINVRVEGHTDTDGDDAHNLDLSQRRAESVVAYLAKQGIDRARLTAQGFGETQPIADNATKKGKAANRRVVFAITSGNDGTVVEPTAPAAAVSCYCRAQAAWRGTRAAPLVVLRVGEGLDHRVPGGRHRQQRPPRRAGTAW
jgi:outer membrane protein OmpA-like peptidoglycan-associated protein